MCEVSLLSEGIPKKLGLLSLLIAKLIVSREETTTTMRYDRCWMPSLKDTHIITHKNC